MANCAEVVTCDARQEAIFKLEIFLFEFHEMDEPCHRRRRVSLDCEMKNRVLCFVSCPGNDTPLCFGQRRHTTMSDDDERRYDVRQSFGGDIDGKNVMLSKRK